MKKIYSLGVILIMLVSVFLWWEKIEINTDRIIPSKKVEILANKPAEKKNDNFEEDNNSIVVTDRKEDIIYPKESGIEVTKEKLPEKIVIEVPFSSQAPLGKWDALHEEACEETSLIMLKYYLDKEGLTSEIAEREIQTMVAYEKKKYGRFEDSDAREIVDIARDFYGINNLEVIYDFKKDDIKKYLSLGNPIIVPAAGRLLGNPNFTPPGPLYHNLVLTGYEGNTVMTNDPGTRKGQNYRYDIGILYDAIHDFPGNVKDIEKGRKAMIIVK